MSPISAVSQSRPSMDSLMLVNSFYGPGATACWYLTCFSCLVTWTIHPKKRIADAITSDLIATITFPCVASAHLITQVRSWPLVVENNATEEQMRASLAASLIVIETYLLLGMFLILPGLFSCVPKRLSLIAMTGIFCITADLYLYFSLQTIGRGPISSSRRFIIDSQVNVMLIIGLTTTLLGLFLAYLYSLRLSRPPCDQLRTTGQGARRGINLSTPNTTAAADSSTNAISSPRDSDTGAEHLTPRESDVQSPIHQQQGSVRHEHWDNSPQSSIGSTESRRISRQQIEEASVEQERRHVLQQRLKNDFGLANKDPHVQHINYSSFPFMLLSFFVSSGALFLDLLSMMGMYGEPRTDGTLRGKFIDEFVPRSGTSIKDLDQAISLFVGMTVLGFNLYTAANAQYKLYLWENKERREAAEANGSSAQAPEA